MLTNVSKTLALQKSLMENYDFTNIIYSEDPKNIKDNHCSTCLGILQHADDKEHIKDVCERIRNTGFEFESFKFTIKIPLSNSIRFSQVESLSINSYI